MGGCFITAVGKTPEEVKCKLEAELAKARQLGLETVRGRTEPEQPFQVHADDVLMTVYYLGDELVYVPAGFDPPDGAEQAWGAVALVHS